MLSLRYLIEDGENNFNDVVMQYTSPNTVTIFVIGYGNKDEPLEKWSMKAMKMIKELKSNHGLVYNSVDVVG